jgi:hypothetical protein
MLVAEMTDQHLANMVRVILKAISEVKAAMNASKGSTRFEAALYKRLSISPEKAAEAVGSLMEKAEPYLAEAYLRGMTELRDEVVIAYGRDQAVPREARLLPRSGGDWLDGFNDDDDWAKDPDEGDR